MVHRLRGGRADLEQSWVDHLQQIEIFALLVEISLEDGGAVIVELAARIPVAPPRRLVVHFVKLVVLNEFSACGNRVFHQKILTLAAADRHAYGEHISASDRAVQSGEIVGDFLAVIDASEFVIVTGHVELESA